METRTVKFVNENKDERPRERKRRSSSFKRRPFKAVAEEVKGNLNRTSKASIRRSNIEDKSYEWLSETEEEFSIRYEGMDSASEDQTEEI